MKRILDIESFLKEAEDTFINNFNIDSKLKIKHKKNKHVISDWIKSVTKEIASNEDDSVKRINLRVNKKLNKQEVYTLKKSALDNLTTKMFNKKNKDYFSNNFIIKITDKTEIKDFPFEVLPNQLVYIYFNFYPLALIKLSKNSSILDPISGSNYLIEEYHQNTIREYFSAPVDKGIVSLEFQIFFGYIILNKVEDK